MIKFYPNRTIEEQKARLPQAFQANYGATVLDQVEIDGNIIRGYMEYSFLNEKSYFEQPTRSLNGSIENINSYAIFLTPRLVIKYSMMNIEDYRNLLMLLQSKNEFTVTCYDPVLDKRVTHKMYAAPTSMPKIYQQYLMALGVQEFALELIGTNNDVGIFTVTYDYNIPSAYQSSFGTKSATQTFAQNASGVLGANATYNIGDTVYQLNSQKSLDLLGNKYSFLGWNTKQDGSGFNYIDGDAYFISSDTRLFARWLKEQCVFYINSGGMSGVEFSFREGQTWRQIAEVNSSFDISKDYVLYNDLYGEGWVKIKDVSPDMTTKYVAPDMPIKDETEYDTDTY